MCWYSSIICRVSVLRHLGRRFHRRGYPQPDYYPSRQGTHTSHALLFGCPLIDTMVGLLERPNHREVLNTCDHTLPSGAHLSITLHTLKRSLHIYQSSIWYRCDASCVSGVPLSYLPMRARAEIEIVPRCAWEYGTSTPAECANPWLPSRMPNEPIGKLFLAQQRTGDACLAAGTTASSLWKNAG